MANLPQRKTIRLQNYNYSTDGFYYVTICTQNRQNLFGDVMDGKMELNDVGKMINRWWLKITKRFKNAELDAFQIMPNHIHGIIVITDKTPVRVGLSDPSIANGRDNRVINGRDNRAINGRDNRAPTTLGQIVAYFKYQSTKQINDHFVRAGIIPPDTIRKIWQRNYYEHIIRTETDLNKIRQYIQNNSKMWERDRNNPNASTYFK